MAFPLLFTLFFYGLSEDCYAIKFIFIRVFCWQFCFVCVFLLLNIRFGCYFVFMFFTSVMLFMVFVISSMKKYIVKSMFSHRYVPLYNTKRYLSDGSLQIQCKYI